MSEYESSILVVINQAQPLTDSRGIARELGIDHESFSTMIKRDQQEIEADFGRIRFQIGVKAEPQRGKLPHSALLTEDQASASMSYSQNTLQARACKRFLVKAFREARAHLLAVSAPQPRIKSLWERRVETFRLATKIPEGYHLPQRLVRRMLDAVSWLLPQRALPGLPPGAHDPFDYDHRGGTSSAAYEQERKRGKAA